MTKHMEMGVHPVQPNRSHTGKCHVGTQVQQAGFPDGAVM